LVARVVQQIGICACLQFDQLRQIGQAQREGCESLVFLRPVISRERAVDEGVELFWRRAGFSAAARVEDRFAGSAWPASQRV